MPLPGPRTHCHLSRPHFIAGAPSLLQTLFLVATRCYKWHHHPLSRGHCSSERPGNRARSPSLTCPAVFQTPGLLLAQPLLAGGVRTPRESVWCLIFPARYHTCHTYPGDLPLGLHFFVKILKILPIIIIMLPSARPRSKHITYISSFDPLNNTKTNYCSIHGGAAQRGEETDPGSHSWNQHWNLCSSAPGHVLDHMLYCEALTGLSPLLGLPLS